MLKNENDFWKTAIWAYIIAFIAVVYECYEKGIYEGIKTSILILFFIHLGIGILIGVFGLFIRAILRGVKSINLSNVVPTVYCILFAAVCLAVLKFYYQINVF